jgi:hypothetical protein
VTSYTELLEGYNHSRQEREDTPYCKHFEDAPRLAREHLMKYGATGGRVEVSYFL